MLTSFAIIKEDNRFINDYFIKVINNDDFIVKFIKIIFKFIKLKVLSVELYTDDNNIKLKRLYLNTDSRDATEEIYNISLITVSVYSDSYINSDLRFSISDLILFQFNMFRTIFFKNVILNSFIFIKLTDCDSRT